MKEILKDIKAGLPWYVYLAGGICLIVFVVGFFMPPIGEIDGSVLKGIGELLGGTWLFYVTSSVPKYIKLGATARIKRGETEIEISADRD